LGGRPVGGGGGGWEGLLLLGGGGGGRLTVLTGGGGGLIFPLGIILESSLVPCCCMGSGVRLLGPGPIVAGARDGLLPPPEPGLGGGGGFIEG